MESQLQQEIKEKVLKRLKDKTDDETILEYIEETEYLLLDYCNIKELPLSLKFTVINIVHDMIVEDIKQASIPAQSVKSVTRGDTSISYQDSIQFKTRSQILSEYTRELNKHRKIRR